MQTVVDQFDTVPFRQQALGESIALQDLSVLVEDDGAHSQFVDGASIKVAFTLDAVEAHVQDDCTFKVRQERGKKLLVLLIEWPAGAIAGDADPAFGAKAGVDVGSKDMEHIHRFQEPLVKLGFQPVLLGNEFGADDDLAIGQVGEGVEGVEVLIVGR
ncbi:hypothetical protein D3C75_970510 [compost metagenome]